MSTATHTEFDHLATDDVFTACISPTSAADTDRPTFTREFRFVRKSPFTIDAIDLTTDSPVLIVWSHFYGCWSVNAELSRFELVTG
jgi:hypothetical protein